MYLPSHFEETRSEVLRAFVSEHPLGTIVGIEVESLGMVGKFKLGQNKSLRDQDSMIHGLLAESSPEAAEMAGVMRSLLRES